MIIQDDEQAPQQPVVPVVVGPKVPVVPPTPTVTVPPVTTPPVSAPVTDTGLPGKPLIDDTPPDAGGPQDYVPPGGPPVGPKVPVVTQPPAAPPTVTLPKTKDEDGNTIVNDKTPGTNDGPQSPATGNADGPQDYVPPGPQTDTGGGTPANGGDGETTIVDPPAPPPVVDPPVVTPPPTTTPPTDTPPADDDIIDPEHDLRNTVITTDDDARTTDYANKTDEAANALPDDLAGNMENLSAKELAAIGNTDVAAGARVDPYADSGRLSGYGKMVDKSLGNVASVDRLALAKKMLADWQSSTSDEYKHDIDLATQAAAAAGQGRSGMLRTQYGNLADRRASQTDAMSSKLLNDAVSGSIDDSFRKAGVLQGAEESLSGREAGKRGEARGERGYVTDVDTGNVTRRLSARELANQTGENRAISDANNRYSRMGAFAGEENQARDNSRYSSSEKRGERDYQTNRENTAFQRRYLQQAMENDEAFRKFYEGLDMNRAGEAGNPADIMASLSRAGVDPSWIAALAQSYGQGGGGSTSGGSAPPLTPDQIQSIISMFGGSAAAPAA